LNPARCWETVPKNLIFEILNFEESDFT